MGIFTDAKYFMLTESTPTGSNLEPVSGWGRYVALVICTLQAYYTCMEQ